MYSSEMWLKTFLVIYLIANYFQISQMNLKLR